MREGGFVVRTWDGSSAVASWFYLNDHILQRRREMGWSDLLHTVAFPCVVMDNPKTGQHGEPRLALFRLRPGNEETFRFAILQPEGPKQFRIITSYPKRSFVHGWYDNLVDKRNPTCEGFALRRRDLHRYPDGHPVPPRWSAAREIPPTPCCEIEPGCFYLPGALPSKDS